MVDVMVNRKHTQSVKWDGMEAVFGSNDLLPMWVADMDFRPPEKVLAAMNERLKHGIFGYTLIGESTAEAIINWTNRRHHWKIDPSWLLYSHGVVPSISTAIQAFTERGDKILLQSPVYTPFFQMIESNEREVINSPLILTNGHYEINFTDFEEKLKMGVKLFLFCSPHNPAGRVWNEAELKIIIELCKQYGVIIVSDEIHADLVTAPYRHIPISSIDSTYSEAIITLMAPSKTFNLAGLQSSFIVAPNEDLREQMSAIHARDGFFTLNTFGIIAMEAAYTHGEEWLDKTLKVIRSNIELIKSTIEGNLPQLNVIEPEGTYLVWVDCRKTGYTNDDLRKRLLERGKLAVNFGDAYGLGGEGFIRINAACDEVIVKEGMSRLQKALAK